MLLSSNKGIAPMFEVVTPIFDKECQPLLDKEYLIAIHFAVYILAIHFLCAYHSANKQPANANKQPAKLHIFFDLCK